MMESLPLTELDAITTTDILVAEGARSPEHQLTTRYFLIRLSHDLDIEAHTSMRWNSFVPNIKDHKEGKLFATVWTIPLRTRDLYAHLLLI